MGVDVAGRESRRDTGEQREHHRPAVGHERRRCRAARRARRGRRSGPRRPRRRRSGTARRARRGSTSDQRDRRRRRSGRRRRARSSTPSMPSSSASSRRGRLRRTSRRRRRHRRRRGPTSPGHMSLSSLRRWTSSRPSGSRHGDRTPSGGAAVRARIAARVTVRPRGRARRRRRRVLRRPGRQLHVRTWPTIGRMTSTDALREEARDLLDDDRRAAPARCTSGPRSATTCRSPGSTCSRRSTACRSTSRCTRRRAGSPPCSTAASRARRCCCAATWTRCRCPRTPGSTSARSVDGTMHACGHDTHTAMLVGAARLLSARRDELAGRVLFMFQPGEEGHHGARFMLDEGLLDVPAARRRHAVAGRPARSRCTSRRRCRPAG